MKVSVDCKTREEGNAIKTAMDDPTIRASVIVTGVLLSLPTDRARARVMAFVKDTMEETPKGAV